MPSETAQPGGSPSESRSSFDRLRAVDLADIANPAHTALIAIDLQNDCVRPDGASAAYGVDVSNSGKCLPSALDFIAAAQEKLKIVVFTRSTQEPDGAGISDAAAWLLMQRYEALPRWYVRGTRGHELISEIKVRPQDLVIDKLKHSAFRGTTLDETLRANGIATVILIGMTTSGCVMYTARDAAMLDYFVMIPTDCIGSQRDDWHEACLTVMPRLFSFVGPAADIIRLWEQQRDSRGKIILT